MMVVPEHKGGVEVLAPRLALGLAQGLTLRAAAFAGQLFPQCVTG